MKAYCQKKNFYFSEEHLRFLAEECYLFYESKKWKDTAYWPPLVMRWVLTHRFHKTKDKPKPQQQSKGKSVRDIILEQGNE